MSETIERGGTMQIMDTSGHTEIRWDPSNAAEVATARTMFAEMKAKGYSIFEITGKNQQGRRVEEFNPSTEKYMVVPALRGG